MLLHSPVNDMTPPGTPAAEALGFSGPLPSEDFILQRIDELRSEKRKVFAMIMAKATEDTKEDSASRRSSGAPGTFSPDREEVKKPAPASSSSEGMPIPTVDSSADRKSSQNTPMTSPRARATSPGSPDQPSKPMGLMAASAPRNDFARPLPPRERPYGYPQAPMGFRDDWKPRPSMTMPYQRYGEYQRPAMNPGYGQGRSWSSPAPAQPPAYYSAARYGGPSPYAGSNPSGYMGPPLPRPPSSSLSRGYEAGPPRAAPTGGPSSLSRGYEAGPPKPPGPPSLSRGYEGGPPKMASSLSRGYEGAPRPGSSSLSRGWQPQGNSGWNGGWQAKRDVR